MTLADGNYLVLSDLQAPFHDKRAVQALTRFTSEYEFDGILCVGDEADQPEPSRWNKGSAAEFADTFEDGLQQTYDVLHGFRVALGPKPFHMMRSNHTDRINIYLSRYAPALAQTSWNRFERIMGYDSTPLLEGRDESLNITFHQNVYEFAPGWVLAHGDETTGVRSSGGTALSLAKKFGQSVIAGHTHKLAKQHAHLSSGGRINQYLWGYEVGHLMDMSQAGYLKGGHGNWQSGFCMLYIRDGQAHPVLVPIENDRFLVEGVTVKW